MKRFLNAEAAENAEREMLQIKMGNLVMDSFAGRTRTKVIVIDETPMKYQIRAIENRTRLGGGYRWINMGETAWVPKRAIEILDEKVSV